MATRMACQWPMASPRYWFEQIRSMTWWRTWTELGGSCYVKGGGVVNYDADKGA